MSGSKEVMMDNSNQGLFFICMIVKTHYTLNLGNKWKSNRSIKEYAQDIRINLA